MSDALWQTLLTGAFALAVAFMQYLTQRAIKKAGAAAVEAATEAKVAARVVAVKTDQVRDALLDSTLSRDVALSGLAADSREIKKLVNGGMKIQLQAYALLAHRLADETKNPADLGMALEADAALAAHIAAESPAVK